MSGDLILRTCSYGSCNALALYRADGQQFCGRHVPCGQNGCLALAHNRVVWRGRFDGAICDGHLARARELADRAGAELHVTPLHVPPICPKCTLPAAVCSYDGIYWCDQCAREATS